MKATGAGCPEVYGALLPGEIENWTNPASQIRNPKYGIGLPRAGPIGDFGFRISGVPTLVEQNELIAVIMIHFFTRKERKRLLNGHFFKKRNAKDLQNRKQSTVQV
jgi:hypothetical protein